MTLQIFWFILIAVLWTGYFFLEGFDFGVGMLLPFLASNNKERRVLINTVGPIWDGNEVWLITAGGATFAAFPNWYATLFSGFYLPLLLIVIALIFRGVAFEYRGKVDNDTWRKKWDLAIIFGSLVPSFLWGVAFANIVAGVPINKAGDFTGTLLTLLNPFAILGGVMFISIFTLHGANFLALKTDHEVRVKARKTAKMMTLVTTVLAGTFLIWNQLEHGKTWTWIPLLMATIFLISTYGAVAARKELVAFLLVGGAIIMAVVCLFGSLYPNVMPSSTSEAFNLTIQNASSTPYTLKMMSIVSIFMVPVVLLYQGWSYWIFRKRISSKNIPPAFTPLSKL
jgi:cytochrome d ubiquinol oxidase subunit II